MNEKLTAYALDELPPEERAAFEAELQADPGLRTEADEMKKFCALIDAQVHQITGEKPELTVEQRVKVLREFTHDASPKKAAPSVWRHPAFWVPTAIAACTTGLLIVTLQHIRHEPAERLVAERQAPLTTEDIRVTSEIRPGKEQAPRPGTSAMPASPPPGLALNVTPSGVPSLPGMPAPAPVPSMGLPLALTTDFSRDDLPMLALNDAEAALPAYDNRKSKNQPPVSATPGSRDHFFLGNRRSLRLYMMPALEADSGAPAGREVVAESLTASPASTGDLVELLLGFPTYNGSLPAMVGRVPWDDGSDLSFSGIVALGDMLPYQHLTLFGNNSYVGGVEISAGDPVVVSGNGSDPLMTKLGAGTLVLNGGAASPEPVAGQKAEFLKKKEAGLVNFGGTVSPAPVTGTGGVPAETPAAITIGSSSPPAAPAAGQPPGGPADANVSGVGTMVPPATTSPAPVIAAAPAAPAAPPASMPSPAQPMRSRSATPAASPAKSAITRSGGGSGGGLGHGYALVPAPGDKRRLPGIITDAPPRAELHGDAQLDESELTARRNTVSGGETYSAIHENPFESVAQQPLSTFSIDVDTASYANVRRFLNDGTRPPGDAVRLEELINYFPYDYEAPAEGGKPFAVTVDTADAPWQPEHRLVRIALKGRDVAKERGPANFVFLVDVSGSMSSPDKLALVKQSLLMLTKKLTDTDHVAIVTYAGESGVALESTPGSERTRIEDAIERLHAGGSTNGASGIRLAYEQAERHFEKEGVNRVILCTDGDFNVGISKPEELEKLIKEKAKSRVFLSVLGFGTGNLKDRTMETLADKGNGNYAYIDSLGEARKVLVEQMNATLITIAKDVKIQVEFNPAQVASYRLLGYENRILAKEDFNNDRKDAGEIGAGHTVTALYEVVPVGAQLLTSAGRPMVDSLKYGPKPVTPMPAPAAPAAPQEGAAAPGLSTELLTVKLRYKQPSADSSELIEVPVTDKKQKLSESPRDFQFAASVAGFGMLLRNSPHAGELSWDMVRELALKGKGEDPQGYRGEFLQLIDKARGLAQE